MRPCPSCGFENAEGAKFCSECGAPLAASASGRREERKVVSVVFVDLVGSTARAETSDPEDVRALLRVYHERARDELESFGGTVEKFIGDAVVAVFGAPAAHEDDPERAVRAALAVRDAVAELNERDPDRDLHVRVAVNTGEALVALDASSAEGEAMVAGDVMNTAARLQSAAPIDGILVGEQTFRATERAVVYEDADPVEAKGKAEPVRVWQAVEARSRLGVDLGGAGRAALVGRGHELQVLVDALQGAREDRSTRLVTLVGVPGIGKSRLLFELGRVADDDDELITWRQGRSLPYGEGVSFWALGEIVKAQAGILESDAAEETEKKLADAVAVVSDEGERAWVARHLKPLVGLVGQGTEGDRRGEAFAAWRRFLEAVAEGGPTVLVFEDLHWADDGLLEFVDGLVDWVEGVPLLVVCTARPELLDRRPDWGARTGKGVTVSLAPLDHDDTAQLVHSLLDRPLVDADLQRALVERAAGNPLYAEEFVRMLEAGGSVDEGLPETVQGIVAARVDLLPADEKSLLQDASVLGKVFWSDALASLGGIDPWQLTGMLRSLERKEFVRREQRSAVAGATQHAFMHALVRDTAYGQLPRAARAARHVAAADWIESLPDDRAEDRAETLAHHYLTAIELLRAAGEETTRLDARAVSALQEAGERSLALGASSAAARFLGRALDLLPDGTEPTPDLLFSAGRAFVSVGREGDELERAVSAFELEGNHERAAEAAIVAGLRDWASAGAPGARPWLARAAELVEGRPPSRARALVLAEQARQAMLAYQLDTSIELTGEALKLADAIGDEEIRADVLVTRGACLVNVGASTEGLRLMEEAIAIVGGRGPVAGRGYTNLGVALGAMGDLRRQLATFEVGLARAEREGDESMIWFTRGNLASALYGAGRWDEALELVDQLLDAPDAFQYMAWSGRFTRAYIHDARGAGADALVDVEWAVAHARELDDAQTLIPALVSESFFFGRHGDPARADRALEEAVGLLHDSEAMGDPQDWQVELVMALDRADRPGVAGELTERLPDVPWRDACRAIVRRDYEVAADVLGSLGDAPLEAIARLTAGRALATDGRLAEAETQLELARAFWRSVGATAFLREADEVLARAS